MMDERRLVLSLIAKNQHTGITAMDLAFAAQNSNIFVQKIIDEERALPLSVLRMSIQKTNIRLPSM